MIDLSQMNSARVDPVRRIATIEGGALLGALDRESLAHGLATTAGTVSHTGVGGLTLGGGFGRLGRRFGLTCDNVRAIDVVTRRRKIPDRQRAAEQGSFWGLRGGGGNFGVATSFDSSCIRSIPSWSAASSCIHSRTRPRCSSSSSNSRRSAPDELNLDLSLVRLPERSALHDSRCLLLRLRADGEQGARAAAPDPQADARHRGADTVRASCRARATKAPRTATSTTSRAASCRRSTPACIDVDHRDHRRCETAGGAGGGSTAGRRRISRA